MVQIFDSIQEVDLLNNHRDIYVKGQNVKIHIYADSVIIVDLSGALKTGKRCTSYSINQATYTRDSFICCFFNWLFEDHLTLNDFIKSMFDGLYNNDNIPFNIYKTYVKGINVYSPFIKMKPINTPTKWTLPHVWKAILAGQIKSGVCDGRYTDDYAQDAADNFGRGNINVMYLAQQLIEHPSGWWVKVDNEKNGVVQLSVNCHHFDNNTLYFKAK
jgi:hypothetical protein